MELFKQMTGAQILHVPYKAIQQAIIEALGGQLHIVCDNMSSMLPHVKAGRMRALGVTSLQRSAVVPDVPTVAEQGLSGYEIMPWSGYVVPARVPREIVLRLNAEINKALFSPTFTERYVVPNGVTAVGGTPEEHAEQLKQEMAKWGKVMRAAGIRPE